MRPAIMIMAGRLPASCQWNAAAAEAGHGASGRVARTERNVRTGVAPAIMINLNATEPESYAFYN